MTIFSQFFSFEITNRIWDLFMFFGEPMIFRVAFGELGITNSIEGIKRI